MCFYLHKDLSHQDLLAFLEMGKGVERLSRQWSKSYLILVHYPPGVPLSQPPSKLHHEYCCPQSLLSQQCSPAPNPVLRPLL